MSDAVHTQEDRRCARPLAGAVLGARALNRALLERQSLLARRDMSAGDALEQLVGMPSPNPIAPYIGLWSRILDFHPDDLAGLVEARKVVRIALMRWTLHTVTARDCITLRPVLQQVMDRRMHACFGRHLDGVDLRRLAEVGRELVEQEPRSLGDVGALLSVHWPRHEPRALANALTALEPLVHVPPRGIWGRNGRAVQTTAQRWLGRSLGRDCEADALILRYLGAYGPATAADMKAWSGLTGLGPVIERLRPELRRFRDEHGRELLDVPDGPLPDPETPAAPRFLADFDNAALAHADRTRIDAGLTQRRSLSPRTVLVDGFVRASWRLIRGRTVVALEITPLAAIAREDRVALSEEGMRLLTFLTADDGDDVRLSVRFVAGDADS